MMKTKEEIMSNPNTRLRTEEEELMYDAGMMDGAEKERNRIIRLLEDSFAPTNLRAEIIAVIRKQSNLFPQDEVERVKQLLGGLLGE
jgi:hypothetical protein